MVFVIGNSVLSIWLGKLGISEKKQQTTSANPPGRNLEVGGPLDFYLYTHIYISCFPLRIYVRRMIMSD